MRVEHERRAEPRDELRDPAQRIAVIERARKLGVDDRVDLARLQAPGVPDRLLAFLVCPAGAVGDDLAVVLCEQVTADRLQRAELTVPGVHQRGADVHAQPEVGLLAGALAGALGGAAGARPPRQPLACRRRAGPRP